MVEGSMTQGAGQGPAVRTATLRDFRVPPYAQVPVQSAQPGQAGQPVRPGQQTPAAPVPGGASGPLVGAPEQPVAVPGPSAAPQDQQGAVQDDLSAVQEQFGPVQEQLVTAQDQLGTVPEQPAGGQDAPAATAPHPAAVPAAESPERPAADVSGHPGDAVPADGMPEGYTPTERDLPVIKRVNRGDTVQVNVDPTEAVDSDGPGPLYVVGDVHGYLDELVAALGEQGLIDTEGQWAAGNARLWFLGDFTDRGPDGIGVIDLVMRLSAEAAAAGGYCKALMGNHELLLIGAKRFGDTPVNSGAGTATFQAAWILNGGQRTDMERLQDVHLQWMSRLDAVVEEDGHLLMHSDTTAYLDYGSSIDDVNDAVHQILTRNDADECWDLFRKLTKRFAFRDEGGPQAAQELLSQYGGGRVVHGHSPIPYLLGEVGTEDASDDEGDTGPVVEGPHVYADGLAIAMDGGVTMAGKLLVVQLPLAN
ncbi:metallophosphoesterase [Streptomyces sp. NPDC088124]|uniref:metallophosphoesterase n=1 Tax=Streptomyces sp. NPDC088124 TaxID=3154654 RepID=UPI0034441E7B